MKLILSLILALQPLLQQNAFAAPRVTSSDVIVGLSTERNLIKNPSAIYNVLDVSTSNAAVARDTTSGNQINGVASFTCDSSSTDGYCEWATNTPPDDLTSGNCMAALIYKGDATLYKAEVFDGTSVVATTISLSNATTWTAIDPIVYPCGTTRKVRFTQKTAGTAPAVNVGNVSWGRATTIAQVSQAEIVGTAYWAAASSCDWAGATGTSYVDFTADTDCPTPTVTDGATAPATKIPQLDISNAKEGKYKISASAHLYTDSSTICWFALTDESNSILAEAYINGAENSTATQEMGGTQAVASGASKSYKFRSRRQSGSGTCRIWNDTATKTGGMNITVMRFPSQAQTATSIANSSWYIDANIGGANPSLGTSNVSSYTEITDSGLTLTQNSGSSTVGIPCASGTTNTAGTTTCASANESIGLTFDIPKAGSYRACASFGHYVATAGSGTVQNAFELVETTAASSAIVQEGNGRASETYGTASITVGYPNHVCGIFKFSSSGTKTIRLAYEQSVTATISSNIILADKSSSIGQRDIHWEVVPITNQNPMPLIIGGVTTSSTSGTEILNRAQAASKCTSNPCTISYQTGSWLSSLTRSSTGVYVANFSSSLPLGTTCTCSTSSGPTSCVTSDYTTSKVQLNSFSGTTATDGLIDLICMSPKQ